MDSEQLEELVEEAVRIATQHDEQHQPAIVLGILLGGIGKGPIREGPVVADRDSEAAGGASVAEKSLQPVVEDTGIPAEDLRRVIASKEGKKFEIGGQDVGVRSKSGRQNRWSAIYCYLKEKVHGEYEVESSELIEVCQDKRCYDSSNFAQNFRLNPFLTELGGRTNKRYRLTKEGERIAKQLLAKLCGREGD